MKVTSGEWDVFASGTIISFNENPISFEISQDFKVNCMFVIDDKNQTPTINGKLIDPYTMELSLINFSGPLDSGNIEPIYVAAYDGKEYFLNFRVRRIDGILSRTMDYTWYTSIPKAEFNTNQGGQNGN